MVLVDLSKSFLDSLHSRGMKSEMQELSNHPWKEIQGIGEACDRVAKFCHAILYLMNQANSHQTMNNPINNVLWFTQYSGKLVFERAVRQSLTMKGCYYEGLIQESVKTAASSKTLEPKLANLGKILEKNGNLSLQDVIAASEDLVNLRAGMRKGSLLEVEKAFFSKLRALAEVAMDPSYNGATTALIKATMKALGLFEAVPGCLDMINENQKYMTQHQAGLASKDLHETLHKMVGLRQFEAGHVLDLAKSCDRAALGEDLASGMEEFLLEIFLILSGQAGFRLRIRKTTKAHKHANKQASQQASKQTNKQKKQHTHTQPQQKQPRNTG